MVHDDLQDCVGEFFQQILLGGFHQLNDLFCHRLIVEGVLDLVRRRCLRPVEIDPRIDDDVLLLFALPIKYTDQGPEPEVLDSNRHEA